MPRFCTVYNIFPSVFVPTYQIVYRNTCKSIHIHTEAQLKVPTCVGKCCDVLDDQILTLVLLGIDGGMNTILP